MRVSGELTSGTSVLKRKESRNIPKTLRGETRERSPHRKTLLLTGSGAEVTRSQTSGQMIALVTDFAFDDFKPEIFTRIDGKASDGRIYWMRGKTQSLRWQNLTRLHKTYVKVWHSSRPELRIPEVRHKIIDCHINRFSFMASDLNFRQILRQFSEKIKVFKSFRNRKSTDF